MAHVPHLCLPGPWQGASIELGQAHRHHLATVLRRTGEVPVTYTDGAGTTGSGVVVGGAVRRGEEHEVPAPQPPIIVAVAPPTSTDRQRFVVEKLAELGVDELWWIRTTHTAGRAPRPDKAAAWATAALEQSRGDRLMRIAGPLALGELAKDVRWLVADPGAAPVAELGDRPGGIGLVVGPEGGLADGDVIPAATPMGLGPRVLRTETAAVVGATVCLRLCGRL